MSLFKVRIRAAWNWGGLSLWTLAIRTWKAIDQHDTLNQAAVVAYYAMLSLFPILGLSLAATISTRAGVADEIRTLSKQSLPHEADVVVREQIQKIEDNSPVGLLSVSAVILLWSASSLFVAVMNATSAAYGVRDSRNWFKRRLMAILLTVIEVALLIGASASAVAWPYVSDRLHLDSLGWLASASATVAHWIVVVIALMAAFELAHYFGPDTKKEWLWISPGSALGVIVLIGASLGFRLYLRFGSGYGETYGALAGVVLMLLWLYLAALALLVGAEVNSVIERAAAERSQQRDGP